MPCQTAELPTARAVGRVMLLQGDMAAKEVSGNVRKLTLGSPVYESDTLNTESKSHAVVAFRDESRITLQESSSFYVEKFKYDKAAAQESAVLRLLKGSVRVVTGLIGRVNHDNYKFGVAGATIGIRGTGFDAWCNGACASGGNAGATPDKPLDGAGVYVWSGAVVLITPNGSFEVALQQAAIIARDTGKTGAHRGCAESHPRERCAASGQHPGRYGQGVQRCRCRGGRTLCHGSRQARSS